MSATVPCFLDIEASGLDDYSYPIEIAWSGPDGRVESHLLRVDDIPEWIYWSDAAQVQHGISPKMLWQHGESPRAVAERMNMALAGATVYVDGLAWDQVWLNTLFDAVGLTPSFRLAGITEGLTRWMTHAQLQALVAGPSPNYEDLELAAAQRRFLRQGAAEERGELDPVRGFAIHDARWDVIQLQEFYHLAVAYESGSILSLLDGELRQDGERWYVVERRHEIDLPAEAVERAGVVPGDRVLVATGGKVPRVQAYSPDTAALLEALEDTRLRFGGALNTLDDR